MCDVLGRDAVVVGGSARGVWLVDFLGRDAVVVKSGRVVIEVMNLKNIKKHVLSETLVRIICLRHWIVLNIINNYNFSIYLERFWFLCSLCGPGLAIFGMFTIWVGNWWTTCSFNRNNMPIHPIVNPRIEAVCEDLTLTKLRITSLYNNWLPLSIFLKITIYTHIAMHLIVWNIFEWPQYFSLTKIYILFLDLCINDSILGDIMFNHTVFIRSCHSKSWTKFLYHVGTTNIQE